MAPPSPTTRSLFRLITIVLISFNVHRVDSFSVTAIESMDGAIKDTAAMAILRGIERVRPGIYDLDAQGPVSDDSTKARLLHSYHEWRRTESGEKDLKSRLVSGLILMRLGELGVHWSFDTARSLLVTAAREYPEDKIVAWMQGVRALQAGEISGGIRVLDSLHLTGFNNAAFLRDYASGVAKALVPTRGSARSIMIDDKASGEIPDVSAPVSYEWTITRPGNGANPPKLPCFTYGVTFELRKPFHLVFAGLKQKSDPEVGRVFMAGPTPAPGFLDQFLYRTETAYCKIFIDPNKPEQTLSDQLIRRIYGCYDSISPGVNPPGSRGISLRCFTAPRYSTENEKYTAIVTFDRPLADVREHCGTRKPHKEITSVRYTLVVQSSSDVKNELDVKLRSLLRLFGS